MKGHVFSDVEPILKKWTSEGRRAGVFSSGSVAAQKLLFENSEAGDLTVYFNDYFDTTTGTKRDAETYHTIAISLNLNPENILFLSDITEELIAAKTAGYQTVQLVREGNTPNWDKTVSSFNEVNTLIR